MANKRSGPNWSVTADIAFQRTQLGLLNEVKNAAPPSLYFTVNPQQSVMRFFCITDFKVIVRQKGDLTPTPSLLRFRFQHCSFR